MESDAMKIMTAALTKTWRFGMSFTTALALFICCGCAHLATVKITTAKSPFAMAAQETLGSASQYLAAAEREQPLPALGHDLLATQIAYNAVIRRPNDT